MHVSQAIRHILVASGFEVVIASDGEAAAAEAGTRNFDVILSDIHMPSFSGLSLLSAVRLSNKDVPVILLTGNPTIETAIEAVSLGALHYLTKPVAKDKLVHVVEGACALHDIARANRHAAETSGTLSTRGSADGERLDRALETLFMHFQPIVDSQSNSVFAYEALMRTKEASIPCPPELIAVAERLGRLKEVGRRVRAASARAFASAPEGALLFVNLHTFDLLDEELYDPKAPLAALGERVVLEITERTPLDEIPDVAAAMRRLRALGYRIAVDDLGAGYSGLQSFAVLEPDFVKLDMSLVRDVHTSRIRQRLVETMARLCRELKTRVVAEGIEIVEERDCVARLGCDLLQGYFLARPGLPFPTVRPIPALSVA